MTLYFSFIPAIDWWCMKPGVRKDRPTQTSPCILTTLAAWDWLWPRLQALRLGSACACPNSPTGQRFTLQDRRKTHENLNDCWGLEEDGHESAFCTVPVQKELRDNLLVNLRSVNSEEIIFYNIHVRKRVEQFTRQQAILPCFCSLVACCTSVT